MNIDIREEEVKKEQPEASELTQCRRLIEKLSRQNNQLRNEIAHMQRDIRLINMSNKASQAATDFVNALVALFIETKLMTEEDQEDEGR